MTELRVIGAIVAVIAAWAIYTVGAIPAATFVLGSLESEAYSAPPPRFDSKGRPALRTCFQVSIKTGDWTEDEDCGPWGGYTAVFQELCGQSNRCYERMMLVQQRCLDRPASCYRFLPTRPRVT